MDANFNVSKTPHIILNEIRMMSSAFKGIHFLLEGEEDCKFWKRYLNPGHVSLVDCRGRANLLGAAIKIEEGAFPPVAGVYDPDFDRLLGVLPHSPNLLVPTDSNDLEITLLRSAAFPVLLAEWADASRLAEFEKQRGMPVADHIENIATAFGRLRFLNALAGHCVPFERLSPYRFVSMEDWVLDFDGLADEYARLASMARADLDAALLAHCQPAPVWAYCQGHDTLRILAQGLRRAIGQSQLDEHSLMKILRGNYNEMMLKQTVLYRELYAMQARLPLSLFY